MTPMLAWPATAGQATFEPDDEELEPDDEEPDDPEPPEPEPEPDDDVTAADLSAFLSPVDDPPSFPGSFPPPESGPLAESEPFPAAPLSTLSLVAPARESVR